jgi:hypothetical protein
MMVADVKWIGTFRQLVLFDAAPSAMDRIA